jgi:hypothetical protein
MLKINILTRYNGWGLQQDAMCLGAILEKTGFCVTYTEISQPSKRKANPTLDKITNRILPQVWSNLIFRTKRKIGIKPRVCEYDINIFLELVDSRWFNKARLNIFIPNQEWFSSLKKSFIKSFDLVLCKTHYSNGIFKKLGASSEYMSFTGSDRFRSQISKDYRQCLHLAGGSKLKGTYSVLELWNRHPEWPNLHVIQHPRGAFDIELPGNVTYTKKKLDLESLITIQNTAGIHVCPSEAEGFGHVLIEAMSSAAVTVTTDAPPMNELVTSERGLLVPFSKAEAFGLGSKYYVDNEKLEEKLELLFNTDIRACQEIGERARDWYLKNDIFFKENFLQLIELECQKIFEL